MVGDPITTPYILARALSITYKQIAEECDGIFTSSSSIRINYAILCGTGVSTMRLRSLFKSLGTRGKQYQGKSSLPIELYLGKFNDNFETWARVWYMISGSVRTANFNLSFGFGRANETIARVTVNVRTTTSVEEGMCAGILHDGTPAVLNEKDLLKLKELSCWACEYMDRAGWFKSVEAGKM